MKKPPKNPTQTTYKGDLCTFIYVEGNKKTLCQRYQKGTYASQFHYACAVQIEGRPCKQRHGANAHGNKT